MLKRDIVVSCVSYSLIAVIMCLQAFYFKEKPVFVIAASYFVSMFVYVGWLKYTDTQALENIKTAVGTFLLLVIPYGLAFIAIGINSVLLSYLNVTESLVALAFLVALYLAKQTSKNSRDNGLTA